ncbi:MAG: hypothetical protein E7648_00400 [Ruminococcaceae bacterium]|nr:hypothetical protein [Oscillospiraceae bacterium]
MNEFSNIAEYSVQKTRSKLFYVAKVLTPIIVGVVPILYSIYMLLAYGFPPYPFFIIFLSIVLVVISLNYFRRIDYDYRIVGSELFFSIVYNRKKRKELGSIDLIRLEKIAPYAGKYADEAENAEYDKVYDFSSSPNDPYVFYAVEYDEDNNTRTLYLFNASEKMLKLIKLYNRRAIIDYPNE